MEIVIYYPFHNMVFNHQLEPAPFFLFFKLGGVFWTGSLEGTRRKILPTDVYSSINNTIVTL